MMKMSKSLEYIEEELNHRKAVFGTSLTLDKLMTIKQDLQRLEKINEVWHDNEPMESVDINDEHLQELYDYINKLEKEKQELIKEKNATIILMRLMALDPNNIVESALILDKYKKAIEILKDKLNLYLDESISTEVENYRYYSLCADTYANYTKQEYDLLKEVLENGE